MGATAYEAKPSVNLDPDTGDVAQGCLAYFYRGGTSTPLDVYQDGSLSSAHPRPVPATSRGILPFIFLPYGDYRVRMTTAGGSLIFDRDLIANPAPPDSGVTPVVSAYETGDFLPSFASTRSGFVPLSGRSIGNASSGATERQNADTEALYTFLWDSLDNTAAPVAGSRGGSAAADFAASKAMTLPNANGVTMIGLDTLSGAASNVIQASTTMTTTIGLPGATVADPGGISIGAYVFSANVPAGTTITDISGTSVTLSANASASATLAAARFSMFADPTKPGYRAGLASRAQLLREIRSHGHGGLSGDPNVNLDHTHAVGTVISITQGTGTAINVIGPGASAVSSANGGTLVHKHPIPSDGSSVPAPMLQPSMTVYWLIKL